MGDGIGEKGKGNGRKGGREFWDGWQKTAREMGSERTGKMSVGKVGVRMTRRSERIRGG